MKDTHCNILYSLDGKLYRTALRGGASTTEHLAPPPHQGNDSRCAEREHSPDATHG